MFSAVAAQQEGTELCGVCMFVTICNMLQCYKLSVEVNVSVNGCFSLYISPVMSWNLSRVYPDPQPMLAGTVSSTGDPERDNQ